MKLAIAMCLTIIASPAEACIRNTLAYTFEDQVNNELRYLVCLHNEQTDAINSQAASIEKLNKAIGDRDFALQMMQRDLDRLRTDLVVLKAISPSSQPLSSSDNATPAKDAKPRTYIPFPLPTK